MKTLRLYYPFDEGRAAELFEISQKWETNKQSTVYATLEGNSGAYWKRSLNHEIIVCDREYLYYEGGSCASRGGILYYDDATCSTNMKTTEYFNTIPFTIDFWVLFSQGGSDRLFQIGTSNQIYFYHHTNNEHSYFYVLPGVYFTVVNGNFNYSMWYYIRLQLNNETMTNYYHMRAKVFYPRAAAQSYEKTNVARYDISTTNTQITFKTTGYQTYIGYFTVWRKYIPGTHNDIPTYMFTHPDYTDPKLFLYYPFRRGMIDESGKGNHLILTGTKRCDTKVYYTDWLRRYGSYYYGSPIGDEEGGSVWPSGSINNDFTLVSSTRTGPIFKFEFNLHVFVRTTTNYEVGSCSDILKTSTLNQLGNNPLCRFQDEILEVIVSSDNTLSTNDAVELEGNSLFQREASSTALSNIYDGNNFPMVHIAEGDSLTVRMDEEVELSSAIAYKYVPLTPLLTWASLTGPATLNISSEFRNNERLILPIGSFTKSGHYLVKLSLTFIESPNYIVTDQISILANNVPIVKLEGGDKVIISGNNISLDASTTYDPDTNSTNSAYTFKWLCSLYSEGNYAETYSEAVNTEKNLALDVQEKGCKGFSLGSLTTAQISISTTDIPSGDYYFQVEVTTANSVSSSKSTKISLADGGPMGLEIKYLGDITIVKFSPTEKNKFQLTSSDTGILWTEYRLEWSINPRISSAYSESEFQSFILPKDSLLSGQKYNISVRLVNISSGEDVIVSKSLQTAKAVSMGNVVVSPNVGVAQQTTFSIIATGCSDPEEGEILYRIYGQPEKGAKYLLSDWQSTSSITSNKITAGTKAYHNRVYIILQAKNGYNVISEKSVIIKVTLPIYSNPTSYINSQLNSSSLSTTTRLGLIESFTDYLDIQTAILDPICKCDINHGNCDQNTQICTCEDGYKNSTDCSISDEEQEINGNVTEQLINNMETIVPINSSEELDSDTARGTISVVEKLSFQHKSVFRRSRDNYDKTKDWMGKVLKDAKSLQLKGEEPLLEKNTIERAFVASNNLLSGLLSVPNLTQYHTEEIQIRDLIFDIGFLDQELDDSNVLIETQNIALKSGKGTLQDIKNIEISHKSTQIILPNGGLESLLDSNDLLQKYTYQMLVHKNQLFHHIGNSILQSNILSQSVTFRFESSKKEIIKLINLTEPIKIILPVELSAENINTTENTLQCGYFDEIKNKHMRDGLELLPTQFHNGIGTCICLSDHATEFAVVKDAEITYINNTILEDKSSHSDDGYKLHESPSILYILNIYYIYII